MKTAQELFDAGLAHIRAQGEPSVRARTAPPTPPTKVLTTCAYRATNKDGKVVKCIIGGLIPDDLYESEWDEAGGFPALSLPSKVLEAIGAGDFLSLINDMQMAHDEAAKESRFMFYFEKAMQDVALNHGLVYTTPA